MTNIHDIRLYMPQQARQAEQPGKKAEQPDANDFAAYLDGKKDETTEKVENHVASSPQAHNEMVELQRLMSMSQSTPSTDVSAIIARASELIPKK